MHKNNSVHRRRQLGADQKERGCKSQLYGTKRNLCEATHCRNSIPRRGSGRAYIWRRTLLASNNTTTTAKNNYNKRHSTSMKQKEQRHRRDPAYLYTSLVSGCFSGAVSAVACAPLDLVRTRLQVSGGMRVTATASTTTTAAVSSESSAGPQVWRMIRTIVREEGFCGCFRGLTATLMTVPAFWGVYFPLYDNFKWRLTRTYSDMPSHYVHMGSAVAAGAISDLVCNPMFVVRTRLQTQAVHNHVVQQSIADTIVALYREAGWPAFYKGMTANLLGLSHVAVQFPVYEHLKNHFRPLDQPVGQENVMTLLLASGLSKMCASVLTYPHEVIRSRMMDARTMQVGFVGTCQRIWRLNGYRGFYVGLPVSLIRVVPNTVLTFLCYEFMSRRLQSHLVNSDKDVD